MLSSVCDRISRSLAFYVGNNFQNMALKSLFHLALLSLSVPLVGSLSREAFDRGTKRLKWPV